MRSTVMLLVCLSCVTAYAGDEDGLGAVRSSQQCRRKGDYKEAERILRDALANPLEARARVVTLNNLADLLREQDRRSEARQLFGEALKSPGITWDQQFAADLGLADLDRQEEKWPASVDYLNSASGLARAHNDEVLVAFAERSLGETWLDAGNLSRAEPLLRRALSVLDHNPRVPKERLAVALDTMASLYRLENKTGLAEETWMRELEIHRSVFGDYHPQTAMVMSRLAELWSVEGDFDKAESWSRQSIDVMKMLFGTRSMPAGSAMVNAGLIEQRARHFGAAADLYSNALDIFKSGPANSNSIEIVSKLYAGVLSQMHKGKQAKQVMGQIQSFHSR